MGIEPEPIARKYYRLAGGRVPVNQERLCRRLGFAIVEWPGPPDFTPLLSVPHGTVVVNRNIRYVRRRFSVAHELGHYALGQAGVQFFGKRGRAGRGANRFAAVLKAVGAKFRFMEFRHNFATRLQEGGAHIFTIKELLGHEDITTTARYLAALEESKRRAVTKLGQRRRKRGKLTWRKSE